MNTNFRYAVAVLFCLFRSVGAWTPMEPSSRTLYVLLHGVNPVQGGLFQPKESDLDDSRPDELDDFPDPDDHTCNDASGASHIWHRFKFSDFLQTHVTGAFNHVYIRTLLHPEDSPLNLGPEFGKRSWTHAPVTCDGPRMEYTVGSVQNGIAMEDPDGNSVVWIQKRANNQTFQVKPILTEAVENWYKGELLKAKVKRNNPSYQMDIDLFNWISTYRSAHSNVDPSLPDLRTAHMEWIPARFVVFVHSMGGLVSRVYLQSDYYEGDIDKLVTLDSPQQGAWAAVLDRDLYSPKIDNWEDKYFTEAVVKAGLGVALMISTSDVLLSTLGQYYTTEAIVSASLIYFSRIALLHTLAAGYGWGSGSATFMNPRNSDLLALNSNLLKTAYPPPAFRIFHHEGTISVGDATEVWTDNPAIGAVLPVSLTTFLQTILATPDLGYKHVSQNQIWGNSFLASVIGGATGLNFMEQGTSVVPYWSSEAKKVALFNAEGADVRRHLYTIDSRLRVAEYAGLIGKYFLMDYIANSILKGSEEIYPPGTWGFRAAKFSITSGLGLILNNFLDVANQTILKGTSDEAKQITGSSYSTILKAANTLAQSHDYATINSTITHIDDEGNQQRDFITPDETRHYNPTNLEEFLYEKPYASLSLQRVTNGSGQPENQIGIFGKSEGAPVDPAGMAIPENRLVSIDYTLSNWQNRMSIKEETYTKVTGGDDFIRHPKRYLMPDDMVLASRPSKFQFIIDDVRPDLLDVITFTTNYGNFVITWVRQSDGQYKVYTRDDSGKMVFLRTESDPVTAKGGFTLMPDDYLRPNESPAKIFGDGQNVIGLTMVNKAGMSNSQRFFMLWQAVPPVIIPNWIPPYTVVSNPINPLKVDLYSNRYPNVTIDLNNTKFKIFPRTVEMNESGDNVTAISFDHPPAAGSQEPKAFEHRFASGPIVTSDGPYWFAIEAPTVTGSGQAAGVRKERFPFYLDRTPPAFSWSPMPVGVNPDIDKTVFARYQYSDQALGQIQGARLRLKRPDGTTAYEFKPIGSAGAGGGSLQFPPGLAEGLYLLNIEGRDAAVPNEAGLAAVSDLIQKIQAQTPGSATTDFEQAWNALKTETLPGGGSAYNFSSAETQVYLDKSAPSVVIAANYPKTVKAGQDFQVAYQLVDGSAVMPASKVKLKWTFTQIDPSGNKEAEYQEIQTPSAALAGAPSLVLGEKDGVLRLRDGKYQFGVAATDDAGNSSSFTDPGQTFIIDRQAPLIVGFFPGRQTYRRGDQVSVGFDVSEANDVEFNRNGLFKSISLKVKAPDGSEVSYAIPVGGVGGHYDYTLPAPVSQSGTYLLTLTIVDWAGNPVENGLAFGVDRALTQISQPKDGAQINGMIAIYGVAGSPDYQQAVPFQYYELSWKRKSQTTWSTTGLQVPIGFRNPQTPVNRSLTPVGVTGLLGFWNTQGLQADEYVLQVCSVAGTAQACDTRSIQVKTESSAVATLFIQGLPTSRQAGVGGMNFQGQVLPLPGSSALELSEIGYDMRLTIKDVSGNVLKNTLARNVKLSGYQGAPASRSKAGFYLWQDATKTWHLATTQTSVPAVFTLQGDWLGNTTANCPMAWTCTQSGLGTFLAPLSDGSNLTVSRSLVVQIPANQSAEMTFYFPGRAQLASNRPLTDAELAAYQANPSDPNLAKPYIPANQVYLGPNASGSDPSSGTVANLPMPTLLLNESSGSQTFTWDGLRQEGAFPSTGMATVTLTAERVLSAGELASGAPVAREALQATGQFMITAATVAVSAEAAASELDLSPQITERKIGFRYRLSGGDALLTATILRQNTRDLVATLFQEKPTTAKGTLYPYSTNWSGLADHGNLVEAGAGFVFRVEAKSSPGGAVLASAEVPFTTVMRDWQLAGDAMLKLDVAADEILPTSTTGLVAVRALPKYRIAADVTGTIASSVDFTYKVGLSGMQEVIAYPKEHFNLFVRRKRDEVQFRLIGQMIATKRGYRCALFSNATRTTTETFYFERTVTVKKGTLNRSNFFFTASDGSYDYAFACAEGGCASDLDRTVNLVLLPMSVPVPDISLMNQNTFTGLFENANRYGSYGGIHPVNGRITYGALDVAADNVIINRDVDLSDPTTTCKQNPSSEAPAGGENGVLDAKETCGKNSTEASFDPNRNLAQIGFYLPAGNDKWLVGRSSRYGCAPPKYEDVEFDIGINVPAAYWDPPFGYNNLANRCLRLDPDNQFLYDANTGFFNTDGFDNNGISDPGKETGITEKSGYLWPNSVQRYRYVPYYWQSNRYYRGEGFAKDDPLSFGFEEHQYGGRNDRFEVGFNGHPLLAGAKYQLTINQIECVDNDYYTMGCLEGSPVTQLGTFFDDTQWEGASAHPGLVNQTYWRTENIGNVTTSYRRNLIFEVREKIKPADLAVQQALLRTVSIHWPPASGEISKWNQDHIKDSRIDLGISGVRFGINDNITEDASGLPNYLKASPYVDAQGYLPSTLGIDQVPPNVNQNPPLYQTYQGNLPPSGSITYTSPFDIAQGGKFVTINTTNVLTDPGITATSVTLNGSPGYRFDGSSQRSWSGFADPQLRARDLDQDGIQDEEINASSDLDHDLLVGEDAPGRLGSLLVFPQQSNNHLLSVRNQLYIPSVGTPGNSTLSLFTKDNAGIWHTNAGLTGLALHGMKALNLDFSPASNLSLPADVDYASQNPAAAMLNVVRTPTLSRSKELITLVGKATSDFRINYLDGDNGLRDIDYQGQPNSSDNRVLGYLDVSRMQGATSLFLINQAMKFNPDGSLAPVYNYRKLDVTVGTPITATQAKVVTSLYGEAEVAFAAGAVSNETFITVRLVDLSDAGLSEKNKLAMVGPVIEVKPSMTFPAGAYPRVKVRLTRDMVGANPVSSLQIYKPDGDQLSPLNNPLYVFYKSGMVVCGENSTGQCQISDWDEVAISGETPTFSHFAVLNTAEVDARPFTLAVTPAQSELPDRAITVTGRMASELDFYYDDDPDWNDANDQTPAVPLTITNIVPGNNDFGASIHIPARGKGYVLAVPKSANSKVVSAEVQLLDLIYFKYVGLPQIVFNGYRQPAEFNCLFNQPGELSLIITTEAGEETEYTWPVTPSGRTTDIVELAATDVDNIEDGKATSRWVFSGADQHQVQVAGPDFLFDRYAPMLTQTDALSNSGANLILKTHLDSRDENEVKNLHLRVELGGFRFFDDDVPVSNPKDMSMTITGSALAACSACKLEVAWTATDAAGNQSEDIWHSAPLAVKKAMVFKVKGETIPGHLENFALPVRLGKDGIPFDFAGGRGDGSEIHALLPSGQPLAQEVELYRADEERAVLWVTMPVLDPNKDAYFILTLNDSTPSGFFDPTKDYPISSIWHLDKEDPGYDASMNGLDLDVQTWTSAPGVLGEGSSGEGFRAPMSTVFPPVDLASSDMTLSAWVRDQVPNSQVHVTTVIAGQSDGAGGLPWYLSESDGRLSLAQGNAGLTANTPNLHDGQWHHVALTFAASQSNRMRLFVDGVQLSQGSWSGTQSWFSTTLPMLVGARAAPNSSGSSMVFDEIRTAWVERSPEWIRMEYLSQKPGASVLGTQDNLPPMPPQPSSAYTVSMKETQNLADASQPMLRVTNNSLSPLSGFTVRLWISRQEKYSQDIIADAYYFNPQGVQLSVHVHPQNANIVYVDLTYPDSFVLAAGTATDIDGAKLGVHFAGYYPGIWDRSNDWSWQGIDTAWRETPYVTLYDRNGSLISGSEPTAASAPVPPIESTKALFGFENRSDWLVSGSAAVSTSDTKTEGNAGLLLQGSGYITVQSRDFTSTLLDKASNNASVDIYLPANPVNPYWKGSVDLYADCPSGGVSSAYMGQVALTALPNGSFSTIQFTLSSQVKSLLSTSHRDLSFKLAVNSPSVGVVLDRFQVKP